MFKDKSLQEAFEYLRNGINAEDILEDIVGALDALQEIEDYIEAMVTK